LLHQHLIQFGLQSMKPHLRRTFLYSPPSATRKRLLILPSHPLVPGYGQKSFF
jgi:hypothetical protein